MMFAVTTSPTPSYYDPMLIAGAIVMVLGGISALCVAVINAYFSAKERTLARGERQLILSKADDAALKATLVADKASLIAEKAVATDQKLDSIKSTAEEAAKNVNGNLSKVQED